MSEAFLAAIILIPLVLTYLLKSSAALGFLALCGGFALQSFAGSDIKSLIDKAGLSSLSLQTVSFLLMLIPTVITLMLCRGPSSRSLKSPKSLLNLVMAIGIGGSFALMALTSVSSIAGNNLINNKVWTAMEKAQSEIIGISALLALILIWLGHRKSPAKHHK